jgi:hypothetical protein
MIECSCDYYGDEGSAGIFDVFDASVGEYRTCGECGATIWPWEDHRVGQWWDCESCDQWADYHFQDGGSCDGGLIDCECYGAADCDGCPYYGDPESCEDGPCQCVKGLEPDGDYHMCRACASACASLLCGVWFIGGIWERIAERNEMTVSECIGGERK